MYKNPLNNGDLSDYNSLKNQQDNGKIIKKYQSRKLKTEPTELQKYYQYLTYQQSILDELNYVAQRMKDENIQKQKEDFNFIEDLKLRREKTMQEEAKMESTIKEMRESLFNYASVEIEKDITPTIITDNELEFEIRDINFKEREEKSALKIEKAILDKIKRKRAKKIVETEKKIKNINDVMLKVMENEKDNINNAFENAKEQTLKEQASNLLKASIKRAEIQPIYRDGVEYQRELATQASQADTSLANIPRNKRNKAGRPKGSKNKPKRTLNL
jgi:hypothetical protein